MRVVKRWVLRALPLAGLFAGCATVNPDPDFRRAAELAERAAGAESILDPRRRAEASARVQELLDDGLTIEEAARVALLHNTDLQAALYDIGLAGADLVQAGLLSNPSLSMAVRLPSAGGLANVDFELAQSLAELWQIPPRKRSAASRLEEVVLRVAHEAAETAGRSREAYLRAVAAERRRQYAVEGESLAQAVLELAQARQSAGAGSALDISLARGAFLEAGLSLKNASLASRTAMRELAGVLGLEIDPQQVHLLDTLPEPSQHELDDTLLLRIAREERLDLRAMAESLRDAEAQWVLETRKVFPNVSVGLALEREARGRAEGRDLLADTARASFDAGRLAAPALEPRPNRATDESLVIGPSISLDLPVFDQNQAQIAKARYVVEQRRVLIEGKLRAVAREVNEAADRARTAWSLAAFHRDELMVQSEKNLELARESYLAGKTNILAVLEAQRMYLGSRDRYASALEEAAAATPRLERVLGLPLADALERTRQIRECAEEASASAGHPSGDAR